MMMLNLKRSLGIMSRLPKKSIFAVEQRGEHKVVDYKGNARWYLNGRFHREDGPAIIYACGAKRWYLNGKLIKALGD